MLLEVIWAAIFTCYNTYCHPVFINGDTIYGLLSSTPSFLLLSILLDIHLLFFYIICWPALLFFSRVFRAYSSEKCHLSYVELPIYSPLFMEKTRRRRETNLMETANEDDICAAITLPRFSSLSSCVVINRNRCRPELVWHAGDIIMR